MGIEQYKPPVRRSSAWAWWWVLGLAWFAVACAGPQRRAGSGEEGDHCRGILLLKDGEITTGDGLNEEGYSLVDVRIGERLEVIQAPGLMGQTPDRQLYVLQLLEHASVDEGMRRHSLVARAWPETAAAHLLMVADLGATQHAIEVEGVLGPTLSVTLRDDAEGAQRRLIDLPHGAWVHPLSKVPAASLMLGSALDAEARMSFSQGTTTPEADERAQATLDALGPLELKNRRWKDAALVLASGAPSEEEQTSSRTAAWVLEVGDEDQRVHIPISALPSELAAFAQVDAVRGFIAPNACGAMALLDDGTLWVEHTPTGQVHTVRLGDASPLGVIWLKRSADDLDVTRLPAPIVHASGDPQSSKR